MPNGENTTYESYFHNASTSNPRSYQIGVRGGNQLSEGKNTNIIRLKVSEEVIAAYRIYEGIGRQRVDY